jgi:hypothetical protein
VVLAVTLGWCPHSNSWTVTSSGGGKRLSTQVTNSAALRGAILKGDHLPRVVQPDLDLTAIPRVGDVRKDAVGAAGERITVPDLRIRPGGGDGGRDGVEVPGPVGVADHHQRKVVYGHRTAPIG